MPPSAPEVWFAIPSANPEQCRKTLPKWRAQGYKIAILQNQVRAEIPADIVVWSDSYPGWAGSINKLCREIVPKTTPIIVSGGDDMLPDPNFTARQLAAQFLERFPDTFGVMQPHGDPYLDTRDYCGSPFLGRRWIETMYRGTGPMCDEYFHCYGDVELYWVAKGLDALWCREDLTHYHDHFTRTGAEQPEWHRAVERRRTASCLLFMSRAMRAFPGHEPVGIDRTIDLSSLRATTSTIADRHMQQYLLQGPNRELTIARMRQALRLCADNRLDPVAIYGAGHHTRNSADALLTPPVRVAYVIDDNPARHGGHLWGYPIVSREEAIARGIRAVVLSSDVFEPALLANCGPFQERGIAIVQLYQGDGPELVREHSVAVVPQMAGARA